MEKMRIILRQLMDKAGDNPNSLQGKSGVPQSTTHRFINGTTADPKTDVVRRWAKAYNVTESQLRGIDPIDGVDVPQEPKDLRDILPEDEYQLLKKIKKLRPEEKCVVYGLFDLLAKAPEAANSSSSADRRQEVISEKNQHRRNSDKMHYSPPHKNQIKELQVETRTGTRA